MTTLLWILVFSGSAFIAGLAIGSHMTLRKHEKLWAQSPAARRIDRLCNPGDSVSGSTLEHPHADQGEQEAGEARRRTLKQDRRAPR